jgi:prevent-host-death family protein
LTEQYSIAKARRHLTELIRKAESGKAVELTRRGKVVAVLLGRKQYERHVSKSRRFSEAWKEFASKVDLAELAIDPDEIFAGVRDKSPGRDVDF